MEEIKSDYPVIRSTEAAPRGSRSTVMKTETVLKFKGMFEEQRRQILFNNQMLSEDFSLQKDDMLDETDMTSTEMETSMRMRLRNRETLFLKKIDEALRRISEGSFGECGECGEDIEVKRLEARPTTTMCLSCKEESERREMVHIDGHKHKSLGVKLRLA
jgi:DnaK suppressor protein